MAAKKLNPDYVPDLSLTSPVMNIGPFPSWSDPKKVRRKKKKKLLFLFLLRKLKNTRLLIFFFITGYITHMVSFYAVIL